jgi:hypothetical protein
MEKYRNQSGEPPTLTVATTEQKLPVHSALHPPYRVTRRWPFNHVIKEMTFNRKNSAKISSTPALSQDDFEKNPLGWNRDQTASDWRSTPQKCACDSRAAGQQSRAMQFLFLVLFSLVVSIRQPSATEALTPAGIITNSIDLRPNFARWELSPCQQGGRPTCSAFTVAVALEYAAAKRQGHGTRLSAEFLNWASNKACGENEDGGFFSDLWKGFAAYGICREEEMPYQQTLDTNQLPSLAALSDAKTRLAFGLQLHWIKEWNVNTGLTDEHLRQIQRTLEAGWPVCAGLRWPKVEAWDDGVLRMCSPDAVRDGHSILLVGYRQDSKLPGGGAFIFRNTAGDGHDGAMPYVYARAYMNDAAWVGYQPRTQVTATATGSPRLVQDPLGSLVTIPTGRNRRVSSNELPKWNDANLDMTILPPGKSLEMPLLEGPGMITHIWLTSHAGRANELNALSLRIYWDGRETPGVEVPLGEFFAVGQGKPAPVESMLVQVSPSGALSCYWKMPFAKSARIVVVNDNPDRTTGLYWQVDWVELGQLPEETPYFHAHYRQEYPAVAARDYLLADLEGTGQYVGTVMSITLGQDGWWGEGDDFFYIDNEETPSLQGTGSEDYFNDAWGFRPRTSHWFGQPRWQGDNAGDSGVCYRWHVLDPVGFTNSLKVAIEHKGNRAEDTEGFYLERPDFINSVAFWYQTGQPKPWDPLPSFADRCVPWKSQHLVRSFRQAKVSGNAKVRVETSGMFGARPVLNWTNAEAGARLTLPFMIDADGRFAVRLTAAASQDFGAYDIEIDNQVALPAAMFRSTDSEELDLSLGTHELKAGPHTLSFHALATEGRLAKPMSVEMLRVLRLPVEATRTQKTHHEAHFIRLGIGRAVYAYRLAYGELPENLETLVKAELMSSRYLADENGMELKSKCEAGVFRVESVGPNRWTHSWVGLDARR